MKLIRVFLSLCIYALVILAYLVAANWVIKGVSLTPSDKTGVIVAGLCWFALVCFIIEIHEKKQGLRADLIDILTDGFKDGYDD